MSALRWVLTLVQGVAWGGVILAGIFFVGRIYARVITFHRLYSDDFFVLVAWLMFLSSTIIWQIYKEDLYENLEVSAGLLYPPPESFPNDTEAYLKASVAVIIFFYSSLWFVKFSFLLFFRRLGHRVRGQNILWWAVTGVTVASWFASLGTLEYSCLTSSFEYLECARSLQCTMEVFS